MITFIRFFVPIQITFSSGFHFHVAPVYELLKPTNNRKFEMLLEIILFVILLSVVFSMAQRVQFLISIFNAMEKLPGPPQRNLLLGNVYYLGSSAESMFKAFRQGVREFYPIYRLNAVHLNVANILCPEDCEMILSNPIHNQKGFVYDFLHSWLQYGVLTSNGAKWQTRRRILTPAFHFSILQQFVNVFNEEAEKLAERLKEECDKSYVDIMPHVSQCTLKAITETALGSKLRFKNKKEIDYKMAIAEILEILVYQILHPWFIIKIVNFFSPKYRDERRVINTLQNFTKELIKDRERNFTEIELPTEEDFVYKGKKRLAMLDVLLSAKKEGIIDDQGVQEEVDTFTFEGHDTTAAAITFTLMLLSCHEDVQEKIVDEMREVLGDLNKKPTYADLQNLKYMERCIKESLRLYPSVHVISRSLGEDLKTHSGYLLPKGSNIVIHIYDVHHNPEIYPDPEKFDPDRFLPENSKNRHPFAYIPFSAGPRNCIGQKFAMLELKATLCAILGNFILKKVDTPETIVLEAYLVLRSKNSIKVKLVPRKKI